LFDGDYESFERAVRAGGAVDATQRGAQADPPDRDRASVDDVDRPLVVLSKNKRASLERDLARCEAEIERLEARTVELEAAYADPELYVDPRRVKEVRAELDSVRAAAERATRTWEHLVETLGDAGP
jgi:Uup-like ABC transporter family protein